VNDKVRVRAKREINTSSIQSPHDTDCQNWQKYDQKAKGYSINVAKTRDTNEKNQFRYFTQKEIDDCLMRK